MQMISNVLETLLQPWPWYVAGPLGQIFGGLLFGLGWALTGACPGPLFAQIGTGTTVVTVTLLSAVMGTWVYGRYREKLPH